MLSILGHQQGNFFLAIFMLLWTHASCDQLLETERVAEYYRRGYTWPPEETEFVPPTPGWTKMLYDRLDQVDLLTLDEGDDVYNAYISTLSSILIKNYTKYGFGFTRAPTSALNLVQDWVSENFGPLTERSIKDRLWIEQPDEIAVHTIEPEFEDEEDQEYNNNRPRFLALPDEIKDGVVEQIQPILEAWAGGIALEAVSAYGLRMYQNTSSLYMHLDWRKTHIISAIFHIAHDTESPWPLVIEDFSGTINEVNLSPGDMMLYESSKCWHGRPRQMNGKWYTSIFVHFRPLASPINPDIPFTEYIEEFDSMINHRVPPHWTNRHETSTNSNATKLVMPETFGYEPDCEDGWCNLKDSVVINGPAPSKFGRVLTGNGEMYDLDLDIEDNDEL